MTFVFVNGGPLFEYKSAKKRRLPGEKEYKLFTQSIWETFYLWITRNWVDKMCTVLHMVASTRIERTTRQRCASSQQIPTKHCLRCFVDRVHSASLTFTSCRCCFLCHDLAIQNTTDKSGLCVNIFAMNWTNTRPIWKHRHQRQRQVHLL